MYDMVIKEFEDTGAILKGHFILSSGRHSDTYLQCARVLMDGNRAARICNLLAYKLRSEIDLSEINMVVAPAMGGVVVGYELGKQLGMTSIFCERVDGVFALRRGFDIPEGANVLVVEDVVTTGKSSLETFECIRHNGGNVVAEACLIDRSNGQVDLGVPLVSLLSMEVKTYEPENLPPALKETQAIKPGSRWLAKK